MEEKFQQLAELLYEKNKNFTIDEARFWVELLWEDFESTRARAGREYKGQQVTEQIVRQWIEHYGSKLHEYIATNPKFKNLKDKHDRPH